MTRYVLVRMFACTDHWLHKNCTIGDDTDFIIIIIIIIIIILVVGAGVLSLLRGKSWF